MLHYLVLDISHGPIGKLDIGYSDLIYRFWSAANKGISERLAARRVIKHNRSLVEQAYRAGRERAVCPDLSKNCATHIVGMTIARN